MEQFKNKSDEELSESTKSMFEGKKSSIHDFDEECLKNARDFLRKEDRNKSTFNEKEKLDLLVSHLYTDFNLNYIFGRSNKYPYEALSRLKEDSLFYVVKSFEDKYDSSLFDKINEAKFSLSTDIDVLILDRISSLVASKNYELYQNIYKERFKK